jgi:hypothetical protein
MICENLKMLDYNAIIINEPIKNSVLQYNYFYKLLYSTNIVVLTSIFTLFELNNVILENDKALFNKNTINDTVFNKLIQLEEYLLNLINNSKTKLYKFKELHENQYFKYSLFDDIDKFNNYKYVNTLHEKNNKFILKISGIWESKENIGLTFKIIIANKCVKFT